MKRTVLLSLMALTLAVTGCASTGQHALNTQGAFDDPKSRLHQDLIDIYDATFCWFQEEHSTFESGTWHLYDDSRQVWLRLGKEYFAPYLAENTNVGIRLTGHTDANGSAKRNEEIGKLRAEEIKALLVDCGINQKLIETASRGEELANPNATPEEAQAERFVEIELIPKGELPQ